MKTKSILYSAALAVVIILGAWSCSYSDGYYYFNARYGSKGVGSDRPNRTTQGKIAFDYCHKVLYNVSFIARDILMFNDYYRATPEERAMMRNTYYYGVEIKYDEAGNSWSFSEDGGRKKFRISMKDGLSLMEPNSIWQVSYYQKRYNYNVSEVNVECAAEYAGDGSIRLQIPGYGTLSDDFYGKCDFIMEYLSPESARRDYSFVVSGKGEMKSRSESWFTIDYALGEGFRSVCYYPSKTNAGYYMEGKMDMTVKNSREGYSRDVHARIKGTETVTITYEGFTEMWRF